MSEYRNKLLWICVVLCLTGFASAHAAAIDAMGWSHDAILGNGEAYTGHPRIDGVYIWFAEDSSVTSTAGFASSGAVTAAEKDFQLQAFTGNNVLRGNGTLTLTSPGQFSELSLLGSATGGNALTPTLTLNFTDATSSSALNFTTTLPNWAVGTGDLNPKLTADGSTDNFSGAMSVVTFDLTAYSDKTVESVTFGNMLDETIFALSAVPEPATIGMLGLGALVTLLIRRSTTS